MISGFRRQAGAQPQTAKGCGADALCARSDVAAATGLLRAYTALSCGALCMRPAGRDLTARFARVRASGAAAKKQNPHMGVLLFGSGGGTRTHTVSPPTDFEFLPPL